MLTLCQTGYDGEGKEFTGENRDVPGRQEGKEIPVSEGRAEKRESRRKT